MGRSMDKHRFWLKMLHRFLNLRKSHLVTGLPKAFISMCSLNATVILFDEVMGQVLRLNNFPNFSLRSQDKDKFPDFTRHFPHQIYFYLFSRAYGNPKEDNMSSFKSSKC